jgi:hypothetical protein
LFERDRSVQTPAVLSSRERRHCRQPAEPARPRSGLPGD